MASIFSRIAAGEIPSYKVAEDDRHFAFLDISPVHPGQEVDYIFDLTDEEYTSLMLFAKRVANAIKKAIPCKKVGVTVIGLDVPHTHVHLVPMNTGADMNFCAPKLTLPDEEMRKIATKISTCFE